MVGPLLVASTLGGPISGCYSHYFGHQQARPESVHPIRVAVHLLDYQAPTMEQNWFQGKLFLRDLGNDKIEV